MIDVVNEIESIHREVGRGTLPAGEARTVRLQRTYPARIEDVWDALTNPERIGRWFLPISGDYRIGGRYQFEGNAGGEIVTCERPHRLKVTWVYGDVTDPAQVSEVEIRLTADGEESTTLDFEHVAIAPDDMWDTFGPGAVGVGWDGGFLGLSLHLATGVTVSDPAAWPFTDEGREFYRRSSEAWGAAHLAAGADPDTVARNVEATRQFYAPDAPPTA